MSFFTAYRNEFDPARAQLGEAVDNYRKAESFNISNNNFAPRFSVSWDPWNNAKTKIFGTWGRYYGETFLLPLLAEQGPDVVLQDWDWLHDGNRDFRRVADRPTNTSAFSISQVSRDLRTSFSDEWTLGFERELAAETALSVTYINRRFRDQFQDIDINHEARDEGSGCLLLDSGKSIPIGQPDGKFDDCGGGRELLLRPDGTPRRGGWGFFLFRDVPDGIADLHIQNLFFNSVYLIGNFNESKYEAVQVEVRRRFYKNWEMEGSYVWSEAIGQAEDYNQGLGDDPTTLDDERGFLGYDQRHLVKLNARTIVPWWGGFRLGSTVQWESGLPYSLLDRRIVRDAHTGFHGAEYNYLNDRTLYETGQRNDQRNESFWTLDVNFQKEFTIGPTTWSTQFEVFNLLNNDRLWIHDRINDAVIAERRFGRRYQVALKVNF
jgi:hypothetical protein